ncbi:hypothetical protein Trydic_g18956 [Trypoxylus dichotomus]
MLLIFKSATKLKTIQRAVERVSAGGDMDSRKEVAYEAVASEHQVRKEPEQSSNSKQNIHDSDVLEKEQSQKEK